MSVGTSIAHRTSGRAFRTDNESLLVERLRVFGLIEPDGRGGWQPTRCCRVELAALGQSSTVNSPREARVLSIRPWTPRRLDCGTSRHRISQNHS